jgi:hypothetical protein
MSIKSNPLLMRLTQKPKRLTTKVILKGLARILMTTLFLTIIISIIREELLPFELTWSLSILLFIAAIPFVTYSMVIVTVAEVNKKSYELLLLTTLDNKHITQQIIEC